MNPIEAMVRPEYANDDAALSELQRALARKGYEGPDFAYVFFPSSSYMSSKGGVYVASTHLCSHWIESVSLLTRSRCVFYTRGYETVGLGKAVPSAEPLAWVFAFASDREIELCRPGWAVETMVRKGRPEVLRVMREQMEGTTVEMETRGRFTYLMLRCGAYEKDFKTLYYEEGRKTERTVYRGRLTKLKKKFYAWLDEMERSSLWMK